MNRKQRYRKFSEMEAETLGKHSVRWRQVLTAYHLLGPHPVYNCFLSISKSSLHVNSGLMQELFLLKNSIVEVF